MQVVKKNVDSMACVSRHVAQLRIMRQHIESAHNFVHTEYAFFQIFAAEDKNILMILHHGCQRTIRAADNHISI